MAEPDDLLASLAQHPAWAVLEQRGRDRMEKHGQLLATEFLSMNKQPDYGQLQWVRGVFAGIKFLIDQPTLDARKLEKLLAEERGET